MSLKKNSPAERIVNGIYTENPTFCLVLGMCPTLATTTSATNAIGMGLSTTAIPALSNLIISLLRKIILNCTNAGEFVYDPFGGSGSTLIAAEQVKRRCLLVELDLEYCQTIIDRFERLSGQEAKKIN